jgi:inner membrane protein
MNKGLVIKLLALTSMALILIVALGRIEWKVQERQATRDAAVSSITRQYAESQQVAGPLLWISCTETRSVTKFGSNHQPRVEEEATDCSRIVRPAQLTGKGNLAVSERYRGIYKARLYTAGLRLNARFNPVELAVKPNQTLNGAYWIFAVSDPRGLKQIAVRDSSGKLLEAKPGTAKSPLPRGFHVPADIENLGREQRLVAGIELAGSGRFDWVPVAENNDFSLNSAWPHPSFGGEYLPDHREISKKGFDARWRINAFATGGDNVLQKIVANPPAENREAYEAALPATALTHFSHGFGVSLIDPVDAYVQSDRAIRYGFLFVLLTLGGFYLFELLKQKVLHPLQYLLVGFAVVVFFLLLLALSEHIGFLQAYIVAASACTVLIAVYGRTLLGNWKASGALGLGYAGLFGGLYQLLASEDHALLMGAWLTFGVLAATMYLTRKLDWQGIGRASQVPAARGLQPE